jgi:hypothetical protein
MSHAEDVNNGNYYIMINSSGYKNSGKESIQNPYPW